MDYRERKIERLTSKYYEIDKSLNELINFFTYNVMKTFRLCRNDKFMSTRLFHDTELNFSEKVYKNFSKYVVELLELLEYPTINKIYYIGFEYNYPIIKHMYFNFYGFFIEFTGYKGLNDVLTHKQNISRISRISKIEYWSNDLNGYICKKADVIYSKDIEDIKIKEELQKKDTELQKKDTDKTYPEENKKEV